MAIEKKDISGYILAGGKSSRMGEDKGLMIFKGKPVVQYVIDALKTEVHEVVIVSNNKAYEQFGLEVIADEIKELGPAGGIYSALRHSSLGSVFIVSCDMPFVTDRAIAYMIRNATDTQIVLPLHDGQLEPLFGVYKKNCLREWEQLIGKGIVKLHDLVNYFETEKLMVDGNELFDDLLFMNINTREDFENATKQKINEN